MKDRWSIRAWRGSMTRRSVFLTLLLSYLAILLLPVTVAGVFYYRTEEIMINHAIRTNIGLLKQLNQITDSRLKEVEQLTAQVAFNPKVRWLLNNAGSEGLEKQLKVIDALKELNKYKNISSFIHDFAVYFQGSDMILTPEMKTDASLYFSRIAIYTARSGEWVRHQLLTGLHPKQYLPSESVRRENVQSNMITFVQSLPYEYVSDIKGQLIVQIDEQQLRAMLTQIEGVNDGSLMILNEKQEVLMSTVHGDTASAIQSHLQQDSGYNEMRIDGQPMILSRVKGGNGWEYVSVIPKKVVLQEVLIIKRWALILLVGCLAAGIGGSYAMAYRSYQPIKSVVKVLTQRERSSAETYRDEFDLIKQSVIRTLEEEDKLRHTLSEQAPVLRSNFLSRLIRGRVDLSHGMSETLDFMDIRLDHDYFGIILIDVADCSQFIQGDTEREWGLVRFVLTNLGHELLQGRGYIVELERDRLAVLLNVPESSASVSAIRDDLLLPLKETAQLRFKLSIVCGVSSIHHGIDRIAAAYSEALMALDYRIVHGTESTMVYEQIDAGQAPHYHYPIETEIQLMNVVKSGDAEQTAKLLQHIFELNWQREQVTPDRIRCLTIELLTTLMKITNSIQVDDREVFGAPIDPVGLTVRPVAGEEMQERIMRQYDTLCQYIWRERSDYHERLLRKMTVYIEANYQDPNFSLNAMADEFEMTSPYISAFFKKYGGRNITEYIAKLRVEEAKQLLADSRLTISDIAQRVGYASDVGFLRFFKKHEGVTPGKYREMLAGQDDRKNG
ncbi:helix-turn-helix domain-containing protein [Paenibacillus thiaminolyticus]|uniref:helix-turn-helix domain-containing protein n=1 Tax=Paenibacillus thiaminolyticus TaxID=49283 RepID=UPI003D2E210C